jgi:hypothetical protein
MISPWAFGALCGVAVIGLALSRPAPARPETALTVGPSVAVVRVGQRRIVITRAALERYHRAETGLPVDPGILKHCGHALAELIHVEHALKRAYHRAIPSGVSVPYVTTAGGLT